MFGIGKSSKSHSVSGPTFFDIRVKTTYKNMLIVKGSQYESPSVLLSGHLVFSLPDSMSAKRISLKLVGRYKLDFLEVMSHSRSTISSPVKQEAVVFEIDWDNLLVSSEGVTTVSATDKVVSTSGAHGAISGSYSSSASSKKATPKKLHRPNAPTSLTLPVNGVSGTPFENLATPSGASFVLPGGNYDLPFKCVLPGDIPETVEGLMAGSVLYKFEASIDRGSFKSPIHKYKYFRIFRTLSSDNLQLSETMQIGKTWPGKIQYEVSIPARAVPIGGKSPLNILLVPLIKGMKLGPIKAQIIQYYAFKGVNGDVYDDQQQILDLTMSEMENRELTDKLAIETFVGIPSNLKKVTQDCDLKEELIKVRHKLKVQINIIQPSGHISELRANLPISFYVSPNEEMTGRTIVLDKHGKIHFRKEEEPLFEKNKHNQPGNNNNNSNNNNNNNSNNNNDSNDNNGSNNNNNHGGSISRQDDFAPPVYEAHIYDQLYGDSSNNNSGSNNESSNNASSQASGAVSPIHLHPGAISPTYLQSGATSPVHPNAVSPIGTPGPVSPLPILQNQTQQQQTEDPGSYFGLPTRPVTRNFNGSPAVVSPLLDASIHNSLGHNIDDELSRSLEALRFLHISDLPSYQDAMDADDDPEETSEFAPNYEDSDADDDSFKNSSAPGLTTIGASSVPRGGLTSKSVPGSGGNSSTHSRTNSLPVSRAQTPQRPSPVGKIELPKPNINLSTSPNNSSQTSQRPSPFRSPSLNNILSRHGSSSNLSPSGKSYSTNTSSSNLSKLAYKKFMKKEKK